MASENIWLGVILVGAIISSFIVKTKPIDFFALALISIFFLSYAYMDKTCFYYGFVGFALLGISMLYQNLLTIAIALFVCSAVLLIIAIVKTRKKEMCSLRKLSRSLFVCLLLVYVLLSVGIALLLSLGSSTYVWFSGFVSVGLLLLVLLSSKFYSETLFISAITQAVLLAFFIVLCIKDISNLSFAISMLECFLTSFVYFVVAQKNYKKQGSNVNVVKFNFKRDKND